MIQLLTYAMHVNTHLLLLFWQVILNCFLIDNMEGTAGTQWPTLYVTNTSQILHHMHTVAPLSPQHTVYAGIRVRISTCCICRVEITSTSPAVILSPSTSTDTLCTSAESTKEGFTLSSIPEQCICIAHTRTHARTHAHNTHTRKPFILWGTLKKWILSIQTLVDFRHGALVNNNYIRT